MELAAAREGQAILGVSAARWYQLVKEPGFPKPHQELSVGKIWNADDLRAYRQKRAERASSRTPPAPRSGEIRRVSVPSVPRPPVSLR
jgi:predicted DNA-binding transcriptional regulator AlpA